MKTLVIDTGAPRFVGIFSAEDQIYTPYYWQSAEEAIKRIRAADRIVTFNGNRYDLTCRGDFPELGDLPDNIEHLDMMAICAQTNSALCGITLRDVYKLVCGPLPSCPDQYRGDEYREGNWQDCYMTFRLWQLWQEGKLKASNQSISG